MRRIVLPIALIALLLPAVASAKLPFFGLEVDPLRPRIGEPITLTMTCFDDAGHTEPWSSCLGAGGVMAWVHPLDEDGTSRTHRLDPGRRTPGPRRREPRHDHVDRAGELRRPAPVAELGPRTQPRVPGPDTDRGGTPRPSRAHHPRRARRRCGGPGRRGAATSCAARDCYPVTVAGSQFPPESTTHTRSPGDAG